jgi:predicted negative regulator of RcsB-dependent stress response
MAEEFMTDDEQFEAAKQWLASNGLFLVGGAVLAAVVFFGWRYYEGTRNERDLKASAQFSALAAAVDKDDRNAAGKLATDLLATYPGTPYADQAELTLARLAVDAGTPGNAIAPLTRVMNESKDAELKNVARLRLARIQIDQGKPDDAIATLSGADSGAFAGRFHEVRGDALYAKKDLAGAAREYQAALGVSDPRSIDAAILQLKISDLGVSPTPIVMKGKS